MARRRTSGGLRPVHEPGPAVDTLRQELRPAVVETHTAYVFFVGDRVYKLKKPVRFPFLDFSTREAREAACRAEVELNRRLAPDVYFGVATVLAPDGEPCDHLVVMRRMPDDRRLSTLVVAGEADACLRRVARAIAAFHARAETSPRIAAAGSPQRITQEWEKNVAEVGGFVGSMLPADLFGEAQELGRQYLGGRGPLLEARVAAGKVRDGHGDLLADDIFCLPDGPRILDCIDFDDRLRYGDVIADAAFLAMDLERLGCIDAAARFLADYREFAGETYPESLADFYVAHRALVRAKVTCLAIQQGSRSHPDEPVRLLRLAVQHLQSSRVRIVLVGGLPGTGKSTLATAIGSKMRWAVLSSDEVRKDIVGIGHQRPAPAGFRRGIYSPVVTATVYEELLARARNLVTHGESVVIDASWTDGRWRSAATAMAIETGSDLVQLACVASCEVVDQRLLARRRHETTSDATPLVAAWMAARADPWPEAMMIDGTKTPEAMLDAAIRAIAEESYDRPRNVGAPSGT